MKVFKAIRPTNTIDSMNQIEIRKTLVQKYQPCCRTDQWVRRSLQLRARFVPRGQLGHAVGHAAHQQKHRHRSKKGPLHTSLLDKFPAVMSNLFSLTKQAASPSLWPDIPFLRVQLAEQLHLPTTTPRTSLNLLQEGASVQSKTSLLPAVQGL